MNAKITTEDVIRSAWTELDMLSAAARKGIIWILTKRLAKVSTFKISWKTNILLESDIL